MKIQLNRYLICFIYVSNIFLSYLFAGISGKLTGLVVDDETGDSLIGVNVQLLGTEKGAATNENGRYTILDISPGIYDVSASSIGYKKIIVKDVRFRIDQTSNVDFSLQKEVIEGEAVTVIAARDIIRQDVATSVFSISSDEIDQLPLSSVEDVVEFQAGIEDGLVIRGGGSDELLFQVDGLTMRDPRTNAPISRVALSAIQELSVERGGFNAEYGQVRSGLINIITREGSDEKYHGSFTIRYGPPQPKYSGISPFDKNSMWLRPFLDNEVCWNGTENGTWDYFTQKQYPKFEGWNIVSDRLLTDSDPSNDLTPSAAQKVFLWEHQKVAMTNEPDYNIDMGFGGPVPLFSERLGSLRFFSSYRKDREMLLVPLSHDDYVDEDWLINIVSDLSPSTKLKATFSTGNSKNIAVNGTQQINSTHYLHSPWQIANNIDRLPARLFSNSWYSVANLAHRTWSVNLNRTLSSKSYLHIGLESVSREYETGPIGARDVDTQYEIVDGYFVDEAPFGFSPLPDVGITGMFFGGHTSTTRDSSLITSFTLSADYSNQFSSNQLVKIGSELVYHDLNLDYGVVNLVFPESNNYVRMKKSPIRGALYLQDKIELKGYIVNIGLRLDYNNANTHWQFLEPFSKEWKEYNSTLFDPDSNYTSQQANDQLSLSPRLAISHPISSTSKLFFNYGHFKQLPTYEQMFRLGRNTGGAMRNYGNPELQMAQTISYELGFDKSFKDEYLLQLAGYYHDIVNQLEFTTFYSADGSVIFDLASNNSYEDIRGFELTMRRSRGKWWSGFFNYTYQVKSAGRFGKSQIYENPSDQREYDKNTRELYQWKPIPQPFARASLTFFTPNDYGPNIIGLQPLADWFMSVLYVWRQGYYSYAHHIYPGVSENFPILLQYKDYNDVSLRIHRDLNLGPIKIGVFAEINNLFNTKRLSLAGFYDYDDRLAYFQSLHLPESSAYNNIPGDDRVGEFRDSDIDYQPIVQVSFTSEMTESNIHSEAIYFESSTDSYKRYVEGSWQDVSSSEMDNIISEKAYIDMPNQTSFNFLNPRHVFIGLRISRDF